MTNTKDAPKKSRAHTVYRLSDGKGDRVPGVTTILGVLNKPALVKWANDLGLQGIDSTKYRDDKADIGTLAHQMVCDYFRKVKTDTSEYSPAQIDLAENCLLSFWEWEKNHKVEPLLVEEPLASEEYRYGGTIDCYCKLDGVFTLLDFKTGKAIYPEMIHQLAAYEALLAENGHEVRQAHILRIGRDNDEGFEELTVHNGEKHFEIFKACMTIYRLQKELK